MYSSKSKSINLSSNCNFKISISFYSKYQIKMKNNLIKKILILTVMLIIHCSASITVLALKQKESQTSYLTYLSRRLCKTNYLDMNKQNHVIANRNYLSEDAIKEINMSIFRKELQLTNLKSKWEIMFWASFFTITFGFIYKFFCRIAVQTKITVQNFSSQLTTQNNKKNVKRYEAIIFVILSAFIVWFSFYGLQMCQQIEPKIAAQLCSYLAPYSNKLINFDEIVNKGFEISSYQDDTFHYQLKLLSVHQKSAHILKMKTFLTFRNDLIKATLILPNHSQLQKIRTKTEELTTNLVSISNSSKNVKEFVNFARVTVKDNKHQLITFFRKLDRYLAKIEYLPTIFFLWFMILFGLIIIGCLMITFSFISLFTKSENINKQLLRKGNNLFRFSIFLTFITLLMLFIIQNSIFLKCMRNHDLHDKINFEEYFKNYKNDENPYDKQFMRKKLNFTVSNLSIINQINMKKLSISSINSINQMKQIQLSQIQKIGQKIQEKQASLASNKKINLRQSLKSILDYLKICEQSLSEIAQLKEDSSIFSHNFSQIGDNQNTIQNNLCNINLSLIMKMNSLMFILLLFLLAQQKILRITLNKILNTDSKNKSGTSLSNQNHLKQQRKTFQSIVNELQEFSEIINSQNQRQLNSAL